jgi:hypothetical protein
MSDVIGSHETILDMSCLQTIEYPLYGSDVHPKKVCSTRINYAILTANTALEPYLVNIIVSVSDFDFQTHSIDDKRAWLVHLMAC